MPDSYGQPGQLQFQHITSDDGLSSSIVNSIIQDSYGFMWIGTADGLNRYDGFNFTVYRNNPSDSTSISENVINAIYEDHNNNLLIATDKGLSLYDRKMDRFKNYFLDKGSPLRGIDCTISGIAEDSDGHLWLSTNVGLFHFDNDNAINTIYRHDADNQNSISSNDVENVFIDRDGLVWVTTRRGLNLFHKDTGSFSHFIRSAGGKIDLSSERVDDITQDHEGNIWVGSSNGVYCITKNKQGGIAEIFQYQHDANDKSSLSINQISSIFVDLNGYIWIGTENGGINLFDKSNRNFWHYRMDDYSPEGINNESIESIFQDKSGNLWFGTYTGGLNITRSNSSAIITFRSLPGAPLSLSHNTVSSFYEDHYGKIWIGTDGGGLNLFDIHASRFSRFNLNNSGIGSNSILCMLEDKNDRMWIGTWAGGLLNFDRKTGKFVGLNTTNSDIPDNSIYTIVQGDSDDLWLGTFENGIVHYQIGEKKFTSYTAANSGLCDQMVVKIVRFTNGRLLVGTTGCLLLFNPLDGKAVSYTSDPSDTSTLSYSRVTDIIAENDTTVWVGTPVGLNRFNPRKGTFTRFYEKDGLPDNFIKGLTLDASGNLWVTTNNGVCRFDPQSPKFKNFTKDDGFQGNEFFERSIFRLKSGALLMGGVHGFSLVNPAKISENKIIPDVRITDLKIYNKKIRPATFNSPLTENITETKSLTLRHDETFVTFSFAVMDFSAPAKNMYAYKMENFDRDWIYPGNKGEVTYTGLNPGSYLFRVIGSNNDGLWNTAGTSISITVLPPWWQALWLKLIIILLFVIILFSVYFNRINQLRNQKNLLERSVELKTAELNQLNASKDKFFSIIAHDLKNPFNTIIGFSEILQEEINSGNFNKSKKYAGMINFSAVHTLRLLENLLDWANSQQGNIVFNPELINLSELFREEYNALNDVAMKKNIDLISSLPDNLFITADRNMIKTILRNLISNSIKFTNRNGKIVVSSNIEKQHIEISVSDNGIGMDKDTISKLFRIDANLSNEGTENEKGTGLGLFLCKEFVEKHSGKIWAESEPGNGSVFKFLLPLEANT
jgi:ligand-binding sensor domain-containing protein/signal transduction histidine kinase